MKKTLFMFTHEYPINCGDTAFIASEIPFLCKKFDRVIVLCLSKEQNNKITVPKNCVVYYLKHKNELCRLLNVFTSSFWKYRKVLHEEKLDRKVALKQSFLTDLYSFRFYLRAIDIYEELKKLFKIEDYPIVFYSYWGTAEVLAASLMDIDACICTRMHGYDLYEERNSFNYQPFKKVIDRRIDRSFFISNQGREYFLENFAVKPPENYKVSYLGTFSDRMSFDDFCLSDQFEIISISNVIPLKRIEMIIDALSIVNPLVKLKWTHIGSGSLLENMKDLANKKLSILDNVSYSFLGFMKHEDVINFLGTHGLHCLINTSSTEGLPVSMMEALSFSIPIIGTDVGGVSEIVDETDGLLLPATAKAEDYAFAIETIAGMSPLLYKNLRRGAYRMWKRKFNGTKNYTLFAEELYELGNRKNGTSNGEN